MGGRELACYPVQSEERGRKKGCFFREEVEGNKPLWPTKKHSNDAGWDLYTPCAVSVLPGQRVTVDTGISCKFPEGTWG